MTLSGIFSAAGVCLLRKPIKKLGAITQGLVRDEDVGEFSFYPHHPTEDLVSIEKKV